MTTTWVAAVLLVGIGVHGAVATRWTATARALAQGDAAVAAHNVGLVAVSTVLQWLAALVCLAAGAGFTELELAVSLSATALGGSALRHMVWRSHHSPTSG